MVKVLAPAAEKAEAFAPVLGIDPVRSDYMKALKAWREPASERAAAPPSRAAHPAHA